MAYKPDGLFASSVPSVLLCEAQGSCPYEVHLLDCSGSEPKPLDGKNVIHTQRLCVSDMCVAQVGSKYLLVATDGSRYGGGVSAYKIKTDELEWSVRGKLEGMKKIMEACEVTTDGHGHLFLWDSNNKSIQMFSTEGRYLGTVMRKGEQGMGKPFDIQWCKANSSLVVGHKKEGKSSISFIQVQ